MDFETKQARWDKMFLSNSESLRDIPMDIKFLNKYSRKAFSFKLSKENFREPVSMADALASSGNYVESKIQTSLNAKNFGISAGSSSYAPDGSTKVKNFVYKDASRGFIYTDFYTPYTPNGEYRRFSPYRMGNSYY